jgi:hypothetical protein
LESTTQEKYLKVVEHLGGKAVWEKTQLQTESLRSSVELFQVGIEHRHRVLKKNSFVSSERRTRITKDSVKLFQVGIEQVQGVHRRRTLQ